MTVFTVEIKSTSHQFDIFMCDRKTETGTFYPSVMLCIKSLERVPYMLLILFFYPDAGIAD